MLLCRSVHEQHEYLSAFDAVAFPHRGSAGKERACTVEPRGNGLPLFEALIVRALIAAICADLQRKRCRQVETNDAL